MSITCAFFHPPLSSHPTLIMAENPPSDPPPAAESLAVPTFTGPVNKMLKPALITLCQSLELDTLGLIPDLRARAQAYLNDYKDLAEQLLYQPLFSY